MLRCSTFLASRRFIGGLFVLGVIVVGLAQRSMAAKANDLDNSLKLIPASASVYCTSLHMGERFQAIVKSRAWARIKEMPVVQMGLMLYQLQTMTPDSGPGKLQAILADPESRKTIDFLRGLLAEESFFYADETLVNTVDVLQSALSAMRYGPMLQQLRNGGQADPNAQKQFLLTTLAEEIDKLKAPNIILGFKVADKDVAVDQIARLEKVVALVLEDAQPKWKSRLTRTKIGDVEYLTFEMDGKMIPWNEAGAAIKEAIDDEKLASKLITRLKKQKLAIAIGVREKYLLVSIGASTDALAKLDQGPRLSSRPELKPLDKFADRRLMSISYISQTIHARLANTPRDLKEAKKWLDQVIPELPLAKDQQKEISQDLAALFKDFEGMLFEPGAILGFCLSADHGNEAYRYDWTPYKRIDGSRPLDLLSHAGGTPLLAVIGRCKPSTIEDYELLVKWLGVGFRYFEEYAVPTMKGDERAKFEKFMTGFKPLIRRIDQANRTMLIPAMADGRYGFVVDTKLQSKHFIKSLPATEKPLPMFEPALVLGVKDASLLRQGAEEYRVTINEILKLLREQSKGEVPELSIPKPKATRLRQGEMFSFDLPAEWGVDKAIEPNVGLSDKLLVLSISRKHAERLLTSTPLKTGGALADASRSRALAFQFDWAAQVDALTPWIDFATGQILDQSNKADDESAKQQRQAIESQVHTVLDVLKVLRRLTGESYIEENAMVTHTVTEWQDVAEK